jgi:CheY-like chemotaxis protein
MITVIQARRLLIVEHDPSQQLLLTSLLQGEGYQTEAVSTLEAALGKVDQQLYDAVLTDLFWPAPPKPGSSAHLHGVQRLRRRCHPTPVGLITGWSIDLEAVERAGFAFALHKPFDLDVVLQRIADRVNAPFTLEHQQQEKLLCRFLQAVSQREEGVLRALCTPTISYYPLNRSVFTRDRAVLGIEAFLAYVRLVHQSLPACRLEHIAIFLHRSRMIARYQVSWQGARDQRERVTGSVQCRFQGALITQIVPLHQL